MVDLLAELATPLRLVVGITLMWASVGKLRQLSAFVTGVRQYRILPDPLALWYGRLLPAVELVTGVLLLVGEWVLLAAILAVAMFTSFAIAVSVNLIRKRVMPCFCFGANSADALGWHTLTRILLLLLGAFVLVFSPAPPNMLRSLGSFDSVSTLIALVPVVTLTAFGLLILSLVELSPLIIRAWTAPAIRSPRQAATVVWTREDSA